jgi:glycosyltransferase involved in cell wall biosynthesis
MTKLSIVTITKNNPDGMLRTLNSIPDNHSDYLQYIVVDGDTGNRSFYSEERLKKIDVLLIGQDAGISDAFNKGITKAQGDYILLLNSGDELISHEALSNAIDHLGNGSDVLCFSVISESTGGIVPNHFTELPPHQGMCVGQKVYELIGGYSISFKLRMDYDFIMRATGKGIVFHYSKIVLSKYESGGISTLISNRKIFYQETVSIDILHKGIPKFDSLLRYFYWSLRFMSQHLTKIINSKKSHV